MRPEKFNTQFQVICVVYAPSLHYVTPNLSEFFVFTAVSGEQEEDKQGIK